MEQRQSQNQIMPSCQHARRDGPHQGLRFLLGGLSLLGTVCLGYSAQAQEFPPCQPPNTNEYLLLVISEMPEQRQQVQTLVPDGTTIAVCDYFGDPVVRIGGFTNLETASAWAQYLGNEVNDIQTFVARPPTAVLPATNPSTYQPRPLGVGYAVLVNYDNRPEVALDVQQAISREVGVAAYRQDPYLLALYTPDIQSASALLKILSDRNFAAMIVDSRQVMLLRANVTTDLSSSAPAE